MKLKKFFICSLTLFGLQVAGHCRQSHCGTYNCKPSNCGSFGGLYVGVAGGEATHFSRQRVDAAASTFIVDDDLFSMLTTEAQTLNHNIYKIKGWGEIYAGYGCQFCPRKCLSPYLGVRIGGNFSRSHLSTHLPLSVVTDAAIDVSSFTSSVALDLCLKTHLKTAELTLDAKPGVVLCRNTMLFGLLGVAFNHAKASLSDTLSASVDLTTGG